MKVLGNYAIPEEIFVQISGGIKNDKRLETTVRDSKTNELLFQTD